MADGGAARRRLWLPDRLPTLQGRSLSWFAWTWRGLFMLALASMAFGGWQLIHPTASYGWSYYGFRLGFGGEVSKVFGQQAIAQGITPGMRLIRFDGMPYQRFDSGTNYQEQVKRPEGAVVPFDFKNGRGRTVTHRLTFSTANIARPLWFLVVGKIVEIINQALLLLAALLLFRQRREPVPAALSIGTLLVVCFFYLDIGSPAGNVVLGIGSMIGWTLFLLGLLGFPDGRTETRFARFIGTLICSLFLLGGTLSWVTSTLELLSPKLAGVSGTALGSFFMVLLLAVVGRLIGRYRRLPTGSQRQQLRWMFFGTAAAAAAWATAFVLPLFFSDSTGLTTIDLAAPFVSFAGTVAFVAGITVSLLRYRLFDADAVIGRSAAYGVLTLGFIAMFAGGEKIIEVFGERYLGEDFGSLAAGIAAAGAAALVVPLHHRVGKWAERRFQRTLLELRHGVPLLVGDLRETAAMEQVAAAVTDAASAAVHAVRGALVVDGNIAATRHVDANDVTAWLAEHPQPTGDAPRDTLFPTRIPLDGAGVGRVGWLLLGPRPDGTPPGKDERDTLADISDPVARALAIVRSREQREAALQSTLAALHDRLVTLELRSVRLQPG